MDVATRKVFVNTATYVFSATFVFLAALILASLISIDDSTNRIFWYEQQVECDECYISRHQLINDNETGVCCGGNPLEFDLKWRYDVCVLTFSSSNQSENLPYVRANCEKSLLNAITIEVRSIFSYTINALAFLLMSWINVVALALLSMFSRKLYTVDVQTHATNGQAHTYQTGTALLGN